MSHPRRVFLIDDDRDDAFLVGRALKKISAEIQLEIFPTFQQAQVGLLKCVEEVNFLPTLVITDNHVLEATGAQIVAWIKAQPLLKRIPVIILTGTTRPADVNAAYEVGAAGYLSKPPSLAAMDDLVEGVMHFWRLAELPSFEPARPFQPGVHAP